MAMTTEERRARLRGRTEESSRDRGQTGLGKSNRLPPLDLSKAGQEVVWYRLSADPRTPNMIDMIPFEITRPEYEQLRQFTGKPNGRIVGDWDYKLEICYHKNIGVVNGPVLCLREMFGQKCPICDDMFDEYRKRSDPSANPPFNEKLAKALQPQWRCIYPVYDYRDASYTGIKLWDYSYKSFEEYLMEKAENSEEGYVIFSDPYDGRTLQIEGRVKKIGENDFIEAASLTFLPREQPWTEDDIRNNFPLDQMLIIPTYEEVCQMYYQMSGATAPGDEPFPSTDQSPARRAAPPATSRPSPQPDTNSCPQGQVFGQDFQKMPECGACTDECYNRCGAKYEQDGMPQDQTRLQVATSPPAGPVATRRAAPPATSQPSPQPDASAVSPMRRSAPAGGTPSQATGVVAPPPRRSQRR